MISQLPPLWTRLLTPGNVLRLMAVLVFAAYVQTVTFELVYDDFTLITLNPWLHSVSGLKEIFTHHSWAFVDGGVPARHYRPMFLVWLWLIENVCGTAPGWFHLFAILTHLGACLLVYRVALRLLESDKSSSALAALLFAIHPSRAETIGWIAGATEALSAVFILASFLCYLNARSGSRRFLWMGMSLLCFAAGLLTKETALLLPVLILACEVLLAPALGGRVTARYFGTFLALTAGIVIAFLLARSAALGGIGDTARPSSIVQVLFTAPLATLLLLRQLVWPIHLSEFYPTILVTHFSRKFVVLPLFGLLLLVAAYWCFARKSAVLKFGAAWFLIFLAPVVYGFNWIQLHDRHLYLPMFGAAIAFVAIMRRVPWPRIMSPRVATTCFVVMISLASAVISAREVRIWRSSIALFTRGVEVAPANRDAVELLAESYFSVGQKEQALTVLRNGLSQSPTSTRLTYALAHELYQLERYSEAKLLYERLFTLPADQVVLPAAHFELGIIEWKDANLPAAKAEIERAIHLAPKVEGYQRAAARLSVITQEKSVSTR